MVIGSDCRKEGRTVSAPKSMDRPDLYVVARFLERLWTPDKEWKKTELQMAVGLNYNVYSRYLQWLQDKGLITIKDIDERHSVVRITEKGVEAYHTMASWIKDVIGDI